MDEQPPILIAYGSLIDKDTISDYFGSQSVKSADVVKVKDYKRIFNTEVTVRDYTDRERAILNAEKSKESEMNAVKIECPSFEDFGRYALREDGYRFRMVGSQVEEVQQNIDRKILMPVERKSSETDILPHRKYLNSCIEASKQWGEGFHSKFLNTTHLMNGETLKQYIEKN